MCKIKKHDVVAFEYKNKFKVGYVGFIQDGTELYFVAYEDIGEDTYVLPMFEWEITKIGKL